MGWQAVYINEKKLLIAVKPENLKLSIPEEDCDRPKLCDIQDHVGWIHLFGRIDHGKLGGHFKSLAHHSQSYSQHCRLGWIFPKEHVTYSWHGMVSAVCSIVRKYALARLSPSKGCGELLCILFEKKL